MNYEIIKNLEELKHFICYVLPDLKEGETYYLSLFARNKYRNDIGLKADKAQLKSFTSDKNYLIRKIKQLQCEIGCYTSDGIEIPNDALALYISINPRSFKKAAANSCKIMFSRLLDEKFDYIFNPHKLVLSEIQKACSKTVYFDLDVDDKHITYDELKNTIIEKDLINFNCLTFLKTRGGFHILVKIDEIDKKYEKVWHNNMKKIKGIDICGDNLIPVAGCVQGDFIPYIIEE